MNRVWASATIPAPSAIWRAAFLTVTADYIKTHSPWVAVDGEGALVACAAQEQGTEGAVLEHPWLLPAYMGRGIGARLFRHMAAQTGDVTFTSDPQADGFYLKQGARAIGEAESAYQWRLLRLFRYGETAAPTAE